MQVKPGKYKTRDGGDAVVLTVDAPVTYGKVIGYIVFVGDGYNYSSPRDWLENGMCYSSFEDEHDLVEYIGE